VRLDLRRRIGGIMRSSLNCFLLASPTICLLDLFSFIIYLLLLIPMHVSGLMTSSFIVAASGFWNVVDPALRDSLTVNLFKKNVGIWLSLSEQ
jgi:hypothetical protein